MKAFLTAMLFGIFEAVLLAFLMAAVTAGKKFKVYFWASVIFISYGIAIWFVMFKYLSLIAVLLCGFLVGLPLTGIVLFFYNTYLKGKIRIKRKKRY